MGEYGVVECVDEGGREGGGADGEGRLGGGLLLVGSG